MGWINFYVMQKSNFVRHIEMFQIIFWQECFKQGVEGHISFETKQDFIPSLGELISAPPFRGIVVNIAHELRGENFKQPVFIHFVQLERTRKNFADVFSLPSEIKFTPHL